MQQSRKKTQQDIQTERPEFVDNITNQLLVTPVTPDFKGQEQKHKYKDTIDLSSVSRIARKDRYPLTNIKVNPRNLYKRNKKLQQQINKYMKDNQNNIDPIVMKNWKELKEKNRDLEKLVDQNQLRNGGLAPGDDVITILKNRELNHNNRVTNHNNRGRVRAKYFFWIIFIFLILLLISYDFNIAQNIQEINKKKVFVFKEDKDTGFCTFLNVFYLQNQYNYESESDAIFDDDGNIKYSRLVPPDNLYLVRLYNLAFIFCNFTLCFLLFFYFIFILDDYDQDEIEFLISSLIFVSFLSIWIFHLLTVHPKIIQLINYGTIVEEKINDFELRFKVEKKIVEFTKAFQVENFVIEKKEVSFISNSEFDIYLEVNEELPKDNLLLINYENVKGLSGIKSKLLPISYTIDTPLRTMVEFFGIKYKLV